MKGIVARRKGNEELAKQRSCTESTSTSTTISKMNVLISKREFDVLKPKEETRQGSRRIKARQNVQPRLFQKAKQLHGNHMRYSLLLKKLRTPMRVSGTAMEMAQKLLS
jgi:hypothetical protein